MRGAVLVALAAAIGNLLQGWDNSTIAGGLIYIKSEFDLRSQPKLEGLIVAASLFGATVITIFCGSLADAIGRRPVLIISSLLFFVSGLIMSWAPNVYVLLLARLLDGFGSGLAITLVPVYVSETAPPEIRGQLNTIPQFNNSGGMFLSYCAVFGMSLMNAPSWRLMLGILSIPAAIYIFVTVFYLPESPRWLVSKGRMIEAKQVLQRLRGKEDVSAELALLVEGLGIACETSIEEYVLTPANELSGNYQETTTDKRKIRLYGPEEGQSWVAEPVSGQGSRVMVSRQGSSAIPLMDPLVPLFGSLHGKSPESGSRSMLFLSSSMFGSQQQIKSENWDIENPRNGIDHSYDTDVAYSDDNLRSPLLSCQTTSIEKDMANHFSGGVSTASLGPGSGILQGHGGETGSGTNIGGGWQLAWKMSEKVGEDGKREGGLQRIYLHPESAPMSQRGSTISIQSADVRGGEGIHVAALVSQTALCSKDRNIGQQPVGQPMVHPSETASNGPRWRDLLEPGVKRALFVGVGLQVLQQIAGINGVLYYAPQILKEAGVGALLSNFGIGPESASLLISAITTCCMLPCIFLSMKLMDVAGRRFLMLSTIPILIVSLIALVFSSLVDMGSMVNAIVSAASVLIYLSCFVMAFGVIPNIICAEIFPTRVRGLCITITALTYWIWNLIITYSLPIMLSSIGLAGVFAFYAVGCILSWIFIFLKVPETKGMPLEVITEFFAAGAKQA